MTIKYIKSDLFSTLDDYIAHGVNCIGVMGAGVARTIKEKYPKAYEDYVEFCRGKNKPGLLGLVKASVQPDGKVILNCFTQEMYGRDGRRQVSYDAVDRFLKQFEVENGSK
jgi:O-acetyl-ADP-ribose deacetylase (regulator of RNase III)